MIRKIIKDYKLDEILGRYLPAKDVGLFLDLAAYSIIDEDNRAQYYPSYAFSHPLFTDGMRIYSDSKVSDFLHNMDEEVSAAFQNDWNKARNHKEPRYIHLYHSTELEAHERGEVEKKINQLTSFLRSHINEFKDLGPGMETYFELHYDENAKKRKGKEREGDKKQEQTAGKFVFFEEKAYAIELELNLCGYFVIVTSEKMTAKEALELYKGRDASEKLFLSDKTFLGNHCLRVDTDEAAAAKVFIEFVALIIRNRMHNCLSDAKKEMAKKPNYMTVPAAIRELEKIEMARQLDGIYRFNHAITATQKTILKAFGLTDANVKYRASEICKRLETGI